MKKLLAILISLCMVSAFAVPVFADANSDYIAAVKAYQAQIAAKEAAYTAAVDAYSKNAKAKADADSAAILKAAKAAQAKADADCLAVIAAGKAAQSQADARVAAVIAAGKATQAKADAREAAYAKAVKAYQDQIAAREAAYIKAVLGGPAGPVGESLAAALTISGDHKVLSPTACGRSPLAEEARGSGQMGFTAALPAWPRHRRGCARTSRGRRPRGPGWPGQHRRGAARPAGKHCRPWRGTPCSA